MGKFLKYSAYTVLALIVVAALAIAILVYTVNPNNLKGPISKQVENLTGRKLIIKGDISWSFFPWLGIDIHDVQMTNTADFGDAPFASLSEADVKLRLLPLISGDFEMGNVVLKGLTVNLIKNKDGRDNWQDLMKTTDPTRRTSENIVKSNTNASRFKLKPLALTISGIHIANANISYQNRQQKQNYAIQNLDFQSQNISLNKAFPVSLSFAFNSSKPDVYGQITLMTRLELNQEQQTFKALSSVLSANLKGARLSRDGVALTFKTDVTLNLKAQTLDVPDFSGKIADLQFSSKLSGENIIDNPLINGTLNISAFNPKMFLASLGIQIPKLKAGNALEKASLQTQFIIDKNFLNLNNLKLTLDQSTLSGDVTLKNQGVSAFKFNIDQLNAGNYLFAASDKTGTIPTHAAAPAMAKPTDTGVFPVELLRNLNLDGTLKIKQLAFNKLQASDFTLGINALNGVIKISPMTASLYNGIYSAAATLDVQGAVPQLAVVTKVQNVQIEPIQSAVTDVKKLRFSGTATLNGTINTRGNTAVDLTKNLNGKLNFALNNGVIKGINLAQQLALANALAHQQAPPTQTDADETPFGNLSGTFNITNGVAVNKDLLMATPIMQVNGSGTVNLTQQSIDYVLKTSALQGKVNPKIIELQNTLGGNIPIKISGTFADYKVYPDMEAILKGIATSYIQQQTGKIQQEVNKQIKGLGGQLQRQLKSVFD